MLVTRLTLCVTGIVALSAFLIFAARLAGATLLRGDEIAFVSYHDINPDIDLIDVNHGLIRNLTNNPAYDVAPVWSPDGNWIAFASDREGRRNIYVMDALGGSLRRLTDNRGFYTLPHWSADGKSLIFLAAHQTIDRIDFDGSHFQTLPAPANPTANRVVDLGFDPSNLNQARSPDGSQLAFLTFRDQGWGIYVSSDDNRLHAHLLVGIGDFTEVPAWSPDGRRMAYIAFRDGSTDLYVVDVSGDSTPRRLTSSPAIDSSPAWRP